MEGHDDVFEVSPRVVTRRGKFFISVKNNKKLDYEKVKVFKFKVGIFIIHIINHDRVRLDNPPFEHFPIESVMWYPYPRT